MTGADCGSFGTANRRFFHGPGINNTDLGLSKMIPVNEAMHFEIRGEFFNIFNHAQFNNPAGDISNEISATSRVPAIRALVRSVRNSSGDAVAKHEHGDGAGSLAVPFLL